jgi:hypothetical protein
MTKRRKANEDEIAPDEALDGLLDDSNPAAVRKALRRRLRTEGVQTALEAMLDVAKDKKAMASARATCAVGLMRAAGYMSPKATDEDDEAENALDTATAAQLEEVLRGSRARTRRLEKLIAGSEDETDEIGSPDAGGALD